MKDGARSGERFFTLLGMACLLAAFALSLPGVRVSRAGDEAPVGVARSLDPGEEESCRPQETVPPAAPVPPSEEISEVAAPEDRPEVIVLNTGGYNYGPAAPPLDPALLSAPPGGPPPSPRD